MLSKLASVESQFEKGKKKYDLVNQNIHFLAFFLKLFCVSAFSHL